MVELIIPKHRGLLSRQTRFAKLVYVQLKEMLQALLTNVIGRDIFL
jgi:hypothetical protein